MTDNVRSYSCSECDSPAYAKGLCNAHYIRSRKGASLFEPVRIRKAGRRCSSAECYNTHYGKGYCKSHYQKFLRFERTSELITLLGGKCADCHGSFPVEVFDFHHTRDKLFMIGDEICNLAMEPLRDEAMKCILLCANCHRIRHAAYRQL